MEKEIVVGLEEYQEQEQDDYDDINADMPQYWLESVAEEEKAGKDLTDLSVQVSTEFLKTLGLEQYIPIVEENNIGIEELVNMDSISLSKYGFADARHTARIIGRARKVYVRSSPPKIDGRPVKVMAKFGIARISEINTVNLTARIKLFIDLYWHDYRMIGAHPSQVPNYLWMPDAYVYNCTDRSGENGGKLNVHPIVLMDPETGLMLNPLEVEVILTNDMNLRKFPFDTDDIVMTVLQSEDSSSAEWIFEPWEGGDGLENCVKCFYNIFETPEFDVNGFSLDMYRSYSGGNGVSYATCLVHIHLSRRPYYYIRNILVPIMLTTTLAFTAFFYDISELEARNNGTATTFLTTVAFLYVITSSLPKTNYSTSINYAVVLSFTVQLIIWALTNLNYLTEKGNPELAANVDYYAAIVLPVTYYISTTVLFAPQLIKWHQKTRFSQPPKEELRAQENVIRDWRLPIYGRKPYKQYFPFIEGKNVFA